MIRVTALLPWGINAFGDLMAAVNAALASITDGLSKASAEQVIVGAVSDATVNAPFVLQHRLGVTPVTFSYVGWGAGVLTATDDDRKRWTSTQIVMRSTTASTKYDVTVKA